MAVLVTGGAGYIGGITAEALLREGEEVVVLDDLSRGHRGAVPPGAVFYHGRVGDMAVVNKLLADHPIEACVHLAAYAYVGESVREPELYHQRNLVEGRALVAALAERGVGRVILSSTCSTYGNVGSEPISEDREQRPESPYGWTKVRMEQTLAEAEGSHALRFVALRYFNAAGALPHRGEDHRPETHLVPLVIRAALGQAPPITVFGTDYDTPDGTCVRDYVHVADLADAHLRALHYLRGGGSSIALNLGAGTGYSVREIVAMVEAVGGVPVPVIHGPRRDGDPAYAVADASRARRVLGWDPAHSGLEQIVASAWAWHRDHPDGYGA